MARLPSKDVEMQKVRRFNVSPSDRQVYKHSMYSEQPMFLN